jgi:hypothetical protein
MMTVGWMACVAIIVLGAGGASTGKEILSKKLIQLMVGT